MRANRDESVGKALLRRLFGYRVYFASSTFISNGYHFKKSDIKNIPAHQTPHHSGIKKSSDVMTTTNTELKIIWVCNACNSNCPSHLEKCELCGNRRPMLSLIPVAVAFCAFLSSIKFMCTVLLPFYGTMPPRDPSSLRTFIVADALSIENLAHCGLTLFLSTLWWLTGVEFFGFFLLVTSTMLTAAAIGELYVVVAMTFHHTTNRYSSEAFGPIVLSSIFFIACFCVLVATCTSKIGGRKRLSLFNIPTAQINRSGLRTIFHVGLLLDVLCSACIFLVEAFGKNHQVIFSTFLPSFTKSFTVSMHHAAICTAGFVALRNLDNFLEVHIMVSIIFSPFLAMCFNRLGDRLSSTSKFALCLI
jgi:hypothetical protein